MKVNLKRKSKRIAGFFKRLPWVLARNAFSTFLGLLLIALIFGVFIFWQYNILARSPVEIGEEEKPLEFEKKTCQAVLEEWQNRNERFLEAGTEEYLNPFWVDRGEELR
jgi:hypothetical protein